MIYGSEQVNNIRTIIYDRIQVLRRVISKRQETIRNLNIDDHLKYEKLETLKTLPRTRELDILIKCKTSIKDRFKEIKKLSFYYIPNSLMLNIIIHYYKEAQKDILGGEISYIGKTAAKIRAVRVKTRFHKHKKLVDWDKSLYVLENIAKDTQPEIYELWKERKILKNDFLARMKPYVYNANDKSLPEWLVEQVNDYLPYIKIRINPRLNNSKLYVFVPTNFINCDVRSQVHFTDNISSKEEIINSSKLGTRDKLFALCRYDDNMLSSFININYFW